MTNGSNTSTSRADRAATLNSAFMKARRHREQIEGDYYQMQDVTGFPSSGVQREARLKLAAARKAEAEAWDAYYIATTTPAQRRHAEEQARRERARRGKLWR